MPLPPCDGALPDVTTTPTDQADRELIDGYLAHLGAARGRRPRTLEAYRMALERLRTYLQGKPLQLADQAELEGFAGLWLHKQGVVARSRKPYISATRGFFAWLQRTGRVAANPALQLQHPKAGSPLPRAMSLASAERLMWAPDLNTFVGLRDAAMLSLLMCGLRVGGLVSLNEGDLRNEEIDGKPRLVIRVTEKGDKERMLPLPREAEMLLRIYLDHEGLKGVDRTIQDARGHADKVLFVNARNTHVSAAEYCGEATRMRRSSVWKMVQRYGERARIPSSELHPHAMRHLFGVEFAEDGVDTITRQKLMGHSDPKSTEIYSAMSMRRLAKVVDASAPLGKIKSPVSEVLRRLG